MLVSPATFWPAHENRGCCSINTPYICGIFLKQAHLHIYESDYGYHWQKHSVPLNILSSVYHFSQNRKLDCIHIRRTYTN